MCAGMAIENLLWIFLGGKGIKGMMPIYKGKGDHLECAN